VRGAKVVKLDEGKSAPITSVTEESVAALMTKINGEYPSLRLRIASEQLAALLTRHTMDVDDDAIAMRALGLADALIAADRRI
jgi:hypothetical protein